MFKLKISTFDFSFRFIATAFVGAILNFNCEIWGFGKSKVIERIHLKFCKTLLNVKMSTSNMGVYGEMGRYPLYINRYSRIIKFWCKTRLSTNILVASLYDSLLTTANSGKKNWAYNVKLLLDSYGFSYVWRNPESIDLKNFHIVFKSRVIDVFKQNWFNGISNCNTLCTYRSFKQYHGIEQYLDFLPGKLRIALARLRLSSHNLRIETGRYSQNRTERAFRYCTICNSRDIEDEYHFIIVCSEYEHIRKKYIKHYYYRHPSMIKFVELMSSSNHNTIYKISKYVYEALTHRISII